MRRVCMVAISEIVLSRDDLLFSTGEVAHSMYFLIAGLMFHTRWSSLEDERGQHMRCGQWCCESVLWTPWLHRGTMRAEVDCELLALEAARFREMVKQQYVDLWWVHKYGHEFFQILNDRGKRGGSSWMSDLQGDFLSQNNLLQVLASDTKGFRSKA